MSKDIFAGRTAQNYELLDEAFRLMENALSLLDRAEERAAAPLLDHAICLIPDRAGNTPRPRLSEKPSL